MNRFVLQTAAGRRVDIPSDGVIGRPFISDIAYRGENEGITRINSKSLKLSPHPEDPNKLRIERLGGNPIFINGYSINQNDSRDLNPGDELTFSVAHEKTGYTLILVLKEPVRVKVEHQHSLSAPSAGAGPGPGPASSQGSSTRDSQVPVVPVTVRLDPLPPSEAQSDNNLNSPNRLHVHVNGHSDSARRSASPEHHRSNKEPLFAWEQPGQERPPRQPSPQPQETPRPKISPPAAAQSDVSPDPAPQYPLSDISDPKDPAPDEEVEVTTDEDEAQRAAEAGEYLSSESSVLGFDSDEEKLEEALKKQKKEFIQEALNRKRVQELKTLPDKKSRKAAPAAKRAKKRPAPPSSDNSQEQSGTEDEEEDQSKAKRRRGPSTAYGRFAEKRRKLLKEKYPDESKEEITKRIRVLWKEKQEAAVPEDSDEDDEEEDEE